ncbi:uncharacterized protein K444DRAFT_259638 [Hyaloscypha bicolor E]|uniref:Uncharacterized protein n=1 Tax=Hyaloscypha bicolor E TaxID=1095630 RepID=A0A2J6SH93_9HELO|nr:uncharacterized protein K444DRAFT_259638 [Hyaloscypha bicolor E]PMD50133.1 hypothetical protein K444DRAFT_259638 [Hyaloscypha bicolor E]
MRGERSRREADVYKAKIGRDAIIDIHVRRYSLKPYYFHPKSTGVSGKRVQGRTHISSGGPSKIRRQSDVSINVSVSTPSAAFQVPHRTIPYHTIRKSPLPTSHLCTSPSHTSKEKFDIPKKRESRHELGCQIHPPCVQGLDSSTGTNILESGDLVLCSELSRLPIPDPGSWFARAETSATESLFAGLI